MRFWVACSEPRAASQVLEGPGQHAARARFGERERRRRAVDEGSNGARRVNFNSLWIKSLETRRVIFERVETTYRAAALRRWFTPVVVLALISMVGWMTAALRPGWLLKMGISDFGLIYLDAHAILSALDVVREGADPTQVNQFDVLWRTHAYSDWWLALRWLGLGRADNFLVGSVWCGSFALACWLASRPRNLKEAGWMAALLLSPPFLVALNRANNDLVIFVLLMFFGVVATSGSTFRPWLAIGILVVATGLKYYPAPAALAFLSIRPLRQMPWLVVGATVGVVCTLASLWPQIPRGQFWIESGIYKMGAPLLGRDFGWADATSMKLSLLCLTLAASGLAWGRFTTGLATRGSERERFLAASGSIVLIACFTAGVSFTYRWIFLFWMALWLYRRMRETPNKGRDRLALRLACTLSMLGVWLDGILCLVVNFHPNLKTTDFGPLMVRWRLFTQPLNWLLMMMLAGWLLEAWVTTLREYRRERLPV